MSSRKRKNAHAVALGKKGGPARAKSLTAERRVEIAKKAARARWGSPDREGGPPDQAPPKLS